MSTDRELPEIYQHFKGNYYILYRIALHHETNEEWAVYRAMKDEKSLFIRPLVEFDGIVEIEQNAVPRFRLVDEHEANQLAVNAMRDRIEAAEASATTETDLQVVRLGKSLLDKVAKNLQVDAEQ